jgi:hypothetical protein
MHPSVAGLGHFHACKSMQQLNKISMNHVPHKFYIVELVHCDFQRFPTSLQQKGASATVGSKVERTPGFSENVEEWI